MNYMNVIVPNTSAPVGLKLGDVITRCMTAINFTNYVNCHNVRMGFGVY